MILRILAFAFTFLGCVSSILAVDPTHRNIEYARVGERSLTFDLYLPDQSDTAIFPTIVWIHGGAWRAGSKDDVPVTDWLKQGFAIVSVDYRLSPEAGFPAQIHDIKAAIRYLRVKANQWSLDTDRCIIAGASAGGHLAALVGVSSGVEALEGTIGEHPNASSRVQAIVSFYGASNLQSILSQSTAHGLRVRIPALQLLLGAQPDENPDLAKLASPVTHVDSTDPPLWLIHGDADPQMPIEQSKELASSYRSRGLPVEFSILAGAKHGGPEFFTSERLEAIRQGIQQTFVSRSIENSPTISSRENRVKQENEEQKQELKDSRPVRMLFAGSSSTYWNDMPDGIARVISSQSGEIRGRRVSAEIVGRSGSDIRVYLDPKCSYQYGVKQGQTFLDKVRDESFDYVVLMVVGRFITGDGENNPDGKAHADAVTTYCRAIRQSGAEPVFYEMGWGTGERDAEGRRRIFELAKHNKIRIYVPCSSVWARIREERPDLALQHPHDNSHPGDLGHFANLACFYAAFVHDSPEGKLPRKFHVWPHWSKEEKESRQSELDAAFAKFNPNEYQSLLPEWMRRNAGAGSIGTVSEADARYIEKVAWETWKGFNTRLENR